MPRVKSFVVLSVLVLAGCSTGIDPYQFVPKDPNPERYSICHGYGCTYRTALSLSDKQWRAVEWAFKPKPKNADAERKAIGEAIAILEGESQTMAELPGDRAEASARPENHGQMDCIDETVNNTQYLEFLEGHDLLRFHTASKPIHRGYFVDGQWPHNTATITELESGQVYAVDGFYRSTGEPPYIIEKEIWVKDWKPDKS